MKVDRQTLARLEWDGVREEVSGRARTPMGRESAGRLAPLESGRQVQTAHLRVDEMRRLRTRFGALPIGQVSDPAPQLSALGVAGKTLQGSEIYEVLQLLLVVREVIAALRELEPEEFPILGGWWARFPELEGVIGAIEGNLRSTGELEDHASPELARLRSEIRQLSEGLTGVLEKLIQAEWTAPVLRDRYITVRNNRFVLPVRTDSPRRFRGIVHGSSSTEKTLFVEPLETVEINNRLVGLADEEAREVERILTTYTEMLRAQREEIATGARVLGEVDLLEAVALWAEQADAVSPVLAPGSGLELEAARHPLLERSLAAEGSDHVLVPLDIDLPRDLRVLVISGPNAGGKTVALKTVGLLTVMAHAGLPVPARQARFPLLESLLCDIGDDQSVQGGLSTFSSHVANLARMLDQAVPPSLVLIDEIGTGTDPAEGAALGCAILERLRSRGVHVVATTHHQAVKTWAYRTGGVLNAACEFDERTLRPTYKLVPGVAGASIGLTMAAQLGLEPEVVEDARRRLDPAGAEATRALESVRELASRLERDRAEVVVRRRKLEAEAAAAREEATRRESRRREQWRKTLDTLIEEFRTESQRLIAELGEAKLRRAMERERVRKQRQLRERFDRPEQASRRLAAPPERWLPTEGERVLVASLNKEGVVSRAGSGRVEVLLGRAMFTVPASDLRPLPEGDAPAPSPAETRVRRARVPEGVRAEITEKVVSPELHLLGMRVDEGLAALDKYLDDASLAGLREARIVHGIGTGRLREAVRRHLSEAYPHLSWRQAEPREGGAGATVVGWEEE